MAQSYDDQISPIIFVVFKAQRYQVKDWINWLVDLEVERLRKSNAKLDLDDLDDPEKSNDSAR